MTNSTARISRVAAAQTGKVQPGRGKPKGDAMKPFLRKSELIRLMLDAAARGSVARVLPDGTIEVSPSRKEQPDDMDNVRMK